MEKEGNGRKEEGKEKGRRKEMERNGKKEMEGMKKAHACFARLLFFIIFVAGNDAIGDKTNLKTTG